MPNSSSSSSSYPASIEQTICDILAGNSAVVALVGQRITPNDLKQGTIFPAVCFQRITKAPGSITNQGSSGVICQREQFDCYDVSYVGAQATGDAIEKAILFYRGGNVQGIFPIDNRDEPKLAVIQDQNVFNSQIEVYIWYNQ
jgi:hypothetical protein